MKRHYFTTIIVLILLTSLTGCAAKHELRAFKGDGCSLFPESSDRSGNDWSECCLEHDITYWQGGTKEERQAADLLFRECIIEKTNNDWLADLMYNAVRVGGTPHFPSWYRWGYGWNYGRGYEPLNEEEQQAVQVLLDQYHDGGSFDAVEKPSD